MHQQIYVLMAAVALLLLLTTQSVLANPAASISSDSQPKVVGSRTGRQLGEPGQNEFSFVQQQQQSGFPVQDFQAQVQQQRQVSGNDYQFTTQGALSIMDTGVVFWTVAGILGLSLAIWIITLFTGVGFFKTLRSGFSAFSGRADDIGFKLDGPQLNAVANRVYKAIELWRAKNQ